MRRALRLESWDTWPRQFVTPPVLAAFVECDRRTIVRMIQAGSLVAFRVGRTWRIPVSEARRAFPVKHTSRDITGHVGHFDVAP